MNASLSSLLPMVLALQANFGSVEGWCSEFVALGQWHRAHAGRVRLDFVPSQGALMNRWVDDTGPTGADGEPMLQFAPSTGLDAAAWVDDVNWAPVHARYQLAVDAESERFGVGAHAMPNGLLLDVRRAGVFEQAPTLLPGAQWRDPVAVGDWARELPADREIVVYCVYGHEVSRATALRLRALGLQARFLQGGIAGWQAAGRPLEDRQGAATAALSPAPPSGSARRRSG